MTQHQHLYTTPNEVQNWLMRMMLQAKHFGLMRAMLAQIAVLSRGGITPIICKKGFRGHPHNDEQKRNNRTKSKICCRVEHVFGFIERSMRGLVFRDIDIIRAKASAQ